LFSPAQVIDVIQHHSFPYENVLVVVLVYGKVPRAAHTVVTAAFFCAGGGDFAGFKGVAYKGI
jgi:hypothetical protein